MDELCECFRNLKPRMTGRAAFACLRAGPAAFNHERTVIVLVVDVALSRALRVSPGDVTYSASPGFREQSAATWKDTFSSRRQWR